MIVTIELAVVTAGVVTKIYLRNQSHILQVAQRVVHGCVADTGQASPRRLEYIARGRVVISLLYDLVNCLSLGRELRFWLGCSFQGFRLILNSQIVKCPSLECGGLAPLVIVRRVVETKAAPGRRTQSHA